MAENLPDDPHQPRTKPTADTFAISSKPANRMILIGAPEWVRGTIHRLHCLGIAEVGLWSHLIPTGNQGKAISILTRYRTK